MALITAAICLVTGGSAQAAQGDLDPTFGTGGLVTTNFASSDAAISAIAIQTDGKIVAAGFSRSTIPNSNPIFTLARYNPGGSLDSTFGTGGRVITSFGTAGSVANAVTIQTDGKIVAAGEAAGAFGDADFALARYNPDGSLDASFGDGGKVITDVGASHHNDQAVAVLIQPDGKIVAAGGAEEAGVTAQSFSAARYNPDGSLDTTFGSGGTVTTNFGSFGEVARGAALQPDGKIVVVGNALFQAFREFALVRFNADGSLDNTFGTGGHVATGFTGDGAFGVAVQPDGKSVVAGGVSGAFGIARYNADGSLDASFGTDGLATVDFGTSDDSARAVALQPDGKIVAAGIFVTPSFSGDFALVRLNPNGTLDSTFGSGGRVTTDFGGASDIANSVALESDGKIVAAGASFVSGSTTNFALARYLGPVADTTPPVITVPGPMTVNATSSSGAVVTYSVSATDPDDAVATLTCAPSSGSTFPIGTTTVTCSASDTHGNTSSVTFTVHVKGAAEQLADLGQRVVGVGPGTSLADKVSQVQTYLTANDIADACSTLTALVNELKAQSGKTIASDQATTLIATTQRIEAVLGC